MQIHGFHCGVPYSVRLCVLQAKVPKLSMQEKNDTLDTLVNQGWIAHAPQSSSGYTIGVRCMIFSEPSLCYFSTQSAVQAVLKHCRGYAYLLHLVTCPCFGALLSVLRHQRPAPTYSVLTSNMCFAIHMGFQRPRSPPCQVCCLAKSLFSCVMHVSPVRLMLHPKPGWHNRTPQGPSPAQKALLTPG